MRRFTVIVVGIGVLEGVVGKSWEKRQTSRQFMASNIGKQQKVVAPVVASPSLQKWSYCGFFFCSSKL